MITDEKKLLLQELELIDVNQSKEEKKNDKVFIVQNIYKFNCCHLLTHSSNETRKSYG